jgi:hypothetical protein
MKSLFICLCALITTLSYAEDIRGSLVNSRSDICTDGLAFGNYFYDLKRVSETEEEAVFEVKSQYGECVVTSLEAYPTIVQKNQLLIYKHEVELPWHKRLVDGTVTRLSENEVKLTFTFHKDRLFTNKSQRQFFVHFWVTRNIRFYWDITVSGEKGQSLDLQIKPIDQDLIVR